MEINPSRRLGLSDLLQQMMRLRIARYCGASVVALGADMGSFLILLQVGMVATLASAASYSLGILVHWLLSSRAVFHDTVAGDGLARTRQKVLFVLSALAGLALTTLIVGVGDYTGVDPRLAKVLAVVASFMLTWGLRSRIVFRGGE
ncbi:GtrA family protein [Novosphingobium mangrovi (ex Huang et al. 2023)]|uniref:GtrA family protein n=1 Tax=Novosphingobium mangrovi (ex Huang et al. 2023) TaxID=2976432 RepID=A0ABT2I5H2_9SPHN|nr:GtrA family protein [Novosphingobium mangrovi (ex Huang et al. 2023)]MCT2400054.1 GtrA family protein [Novosphingobium mangrovi (ex Huang et al. 2023)]